jgi:hypothetical protein
MGKEISKLLASMVERKKSVREQTRLTSFKPKTVADLLPIARELILCDHPHLVQRPEKSVYLSAVSARLLRSSYTLAVRDDKDIITYRLKSGEGLAHARAGAVLFATELGLSLLPDQTTGTIALQSGISDPGDPKQMASGREIVIHCYNPQFSGPINEMRILMGDIYSRGLESSGFNHRWLKPFACTMFDCVAMAFAHFGVVREDLPGLNWTTSGVKIIRRRFLSTNPDLVTGINQTEYPQRLPRISYRELNELRLKVKRRFTMANLTACRLLGFNNAPDFRGLSLPEIAERCFPFMILPMFDRVRQEEKAREIKGHLETARHREYVDRRSSMHETVQRELSALQIEFTALFDHSWSSFAFLKGQVPIDRLFDELVVNADKTRKLIRNELAQLSRTGGELTVDSARQGSPTIKSYPEPIIDDLLGMSLAEYIESLSKKLI